MKTITPEYARLNQQLHATREDYGCKSRRHISRVMALRKLYDCQSILDYGCGKGSLVKEIQQTCAGLPVQGYDPGHPDFTAPPEPADLLVCTDVLEHIEPDLVTNVLQDIQRLSRKAAFFVIALREDSSKLLPDGTNPHKVVQDIGDWLSDMSDAWGKKGWEATIHDYTPDKQVSLSVKWL